MILFVIGFYYTHHDTRCVVTRGMEGAVKSFELPCDCFGDHVYIYIYYNIYMIITRGFDWGVGVGKLSMFKVGKARK